MNSKQSTVFFSLVDYLEDIEDLCHLRIAINDEEDACLYYGWIKYLRGVQTPLILSKFSPQYRDEKKYLLELVKNTSDKALNKMIEEKRHDPFNTLVLALEDSKKDISSYITKAKGPEPKMYTDEFEEWEGYVDDVYGFERGVMFENFWKGGGREGEAISLDYMNWINADINLKSEWNRVIDNTIKIIKDGNVDKFDRSLETVIGRRNVLTDELRKNGLVLRSDSISCGGFIRNGKGNISDIVNTMKEMDFLYAKTNYYSRVTNKQFRADIEVIKLYAAKDFIEKNPKRVQEVPDTLIAKVNEHFNSS